MDKRHTCISNCACRSDTSESPDKFFSKLQAFSVPCMDRQTYEVKVIQTLNETRCQLSDMVVFIALAFRFTRDTVRNPRTRLLIWRKKGWCHFELVINEEITKSSQDLWLMCVTDENTNVCTPPLCFCENKGYVFWCICTLMSLSAIPWYKMVIQVMLSWKKSGKLILG